MTPALPTYALYGEFDRSKGTDWLHCESIAERSHRHDWEIQPHRHDQLFQILYIRRGRAELTLEGQASSLTGPCVLSIPALVPHGFRFGPGIDGAVITVLERHLVALLDGVAGLRERMSRPQVLKLRVGAASARAIDRAVRGVQQEFHGTASWRALAIDAALLSLVVEIGRAALTVDAGAPPGGTGSARATEHVRRYQTLVEQRFREQPALTDIAQALGITPTQLNRVCHQVLGHPALDVLHARLLLEAQRELVYTTLSIKQVAMDLGFTDAGYFTRFFQRRAGRTPSAWRLAASR